MVRAVELYIVYNCEEEAGLYPFEGFSPYSALVALINASLS